MSMVSSLRRPQASRISRTNLGIASPPLASRQLSHQLEAIQCPTTNEYQNQRFFEEMYSFILWQLSNVIIPPTSLKTVQPSNIASLYFSASLEYPAPLVWRPPDQTPPSISIPTFVSRLAKSILHFLTGWKRCSSTSSCPCMDFHRAANFSSSALDFLGFGSFDDSFVNESGDDLLFDFGAVFCIVNNLLNSKR